MSLSDVYAKVRPACVGIAVRDGEPYSASPPKKGWLCLGSGACIDPSGVVVTARHVVQGLCARVDLSPQSQTLETPPFEVLFTSVSDEGGHVTSAVAQSTWMPNDDSPTSDIAIIHLSLEEPRRFPSFRFPPTNEDLKEGDYVATVGYPIRSRADRDVFPNISAGIVSRFRRGRDSNTGRGIIREIGLDLTVHGGNSGGPLFAASSGSLWGVVTSSYGPPESNYGTNLSFAVTWPNIIAVWQAANGALIKRGMASRGSLAGPVSD